MNRQLRIVFAPFRTIPITLYIYLIPTTAASITPVPMARHTPISVPISCIGVR